MNAVQLSRLAGLLLWLLPPSLCAQAEVASPEVASPEVASHWAFQPVRRPPVPTVAGNQWQNPIDAFVVARLTEAGLTLAPEADRTTLIRRLHFVMLGMPPLPEEVATFVADPRADAFERLVDQVLADPRYGERWGRHWLDVIRFAETNGFETNRDRPNAWRFRDYVLGAFTNDLPYDQFVREQLAGDALGTPVATGFLVGGPVDIVGSPDPVLTAEQRVVELDDMVATTGTAFLGLTVGCARCHAHKFDPISHQEYYALSAVFAGVKHGDRDLPMPAERAAELAQIEARLASLDAKLAPYVVPPGAARQAGQDAGLRAPVEFARNEESLVPLLAKFVRFTILTTTGAEPCLDELEVWSGERNVALATSGTTATASGTLPGYAIHQLEHVHDGRVGNSHSWISNEPGRGWVQLEFPKPERIDRIVWGRDRDGIVRDRLAVQYRIEAAVDADQWQVVATGADRAPPIFANAAPAGPVYRFDGATATDAAQARAWLAERQAAQAQRKALAQPPRVYAGTFAQPGPVHRLHRGDPMLPREAVTPGPLGLFHSSRAAAELTAEQSAEQSAKHSAKHSANAPEQQRRLRLAAWITDPEHPLTSRVLVNRLWQYQFGTGLVSTPSDFGRNGARPSHPELLDWLASEFVARGWRIKTLQRQILLSAVWRQASAPRPDGVRVDAGSRLLWRFPPRRLEAEAIRDSILATSGALDRTAGGPGFFLHDVDRENVYHYRPKEDFGPGEMRRMVYAVKVRMEQDAVFGSFDCPDGSLVMPKRGASTTPLQALNLWNSRFLLQQADLLAARLQRDVGAAAATPALVVLAWQLVYQRAPEPGELAAAVGLVAAEGLPALCRALLNSNEFLFVP